jgi:hypothetical protein
VEEFDKPSVPSLPQRILQLFFSPGELFAALKGNPVWFGVLLVGGIIAAASVAFIPTDIWVEMTRTQLLEAGQDMPPGMDGAGVFVRIFAILGGGFFFFVWSFILTAIVTLFFSLLFGGEGKYRQFLSVVAHASIIMALGGLVVLPLRIAQGDPTVTLSLGTFAFFLEDGYFLNVLKLLDLFSLWAYAVMAVGVTKMDPKRSLGFALSFFAAFALVFSLIFGKFA